MDALTAGSHITVDRERGTVVMTVAFGDERVLRLSFGKASFIPDNLMVVEYAVGATYATDGGIVRTEILAQEIDIDAEGRYLLRLSPLGEFGLAFCSFSLTEGPASADDGQPGKFVLSGNEQSDG